jgi:Sensors of blue-light using FAD
MTNIWHLLYCSEQVYEMDASDMLKLLFDARTFNREHGITGLLLHHGGRFMQLLEGEESDLRGLYDRIKADARHHDLVLEVDSPASERLFPGWSMGYAEAPEIDGHAALSGADSERDALVSLHALPGDHACKRRLLGFLGVAG